MNKKNKIVSVRIEKVADESSSLEQDLGRFSDVLAGEKYAIVRSGESEGKFAMDIKNQDELRAESLKTPSLLFFIPDSAKYINESEADIRKYCLEDWRRVEAFYNGEWGFVGIIAKAEVLVLGQLQTIRSGGLWGIESDFTDCIAEVELEELDNLKTQLLSLGFKNRAINYAVKKCEDRL